MDFFLKENNNFIPFSLQHAIVALFCILFGFALIAITKKQPKKTQSIIGNVLAFVFAINLFDLGGSDSLVKKGYAVENLMDFPGH